MKCITCGARLYVYKTRTRSGITKRRYKCPQCQTKLETEESILRVVKTSPYLDRVSKWLQQGGIVALYSKTGRYEGLLS